MFFKLRYLVLFSVSLGLHLSLLFIPLSSGKVVVPTAGSLVDVVARQVASFVPSPEVRETPLVKSIPLLTARGKSPSQNRQAPASIPHKVKEGSAPAVAAQVSAEASILSLPTSETASLEGRAQFVDGGGLPETVSKPSEATMFDVADLFDFDYPSTVTDQAVVSAGHSGGGETQALPRYTENPRPRYPDVARRKGWSGIVEIGVRVNTSGRVVKLSIVQSSGFSVLDRAARRAVRLWQFVPATRLGHNVAADVVVPIDFRLPATDGS